MKFSRILWLTFLLTVLVLPASALAQTKSGVFSASPNKKIDFISEELTSKSNFSGVIVDYEEIESADDKVDFRIRFKETDGTFSEWVSIRPDIDGDHGHDDSKRDYLINTNLASGYQYKVSIQAGPDSVSPLLQNIKFTFINALGAETETSNNSFGLVAALNKSPLLSIIPRSKWGAVDSYNYSDKKPTTSSDGDKTKATISDSDIDKIIDKEGGKYLQWPYEYMKNVKMIVVHHTASTSDLDNPAQAIRNIHYYHAVRRGWGDIGYNYIIDTKGNIYEGHKGGEKVVGGHAIPVNKASIGVAVMGNFESQAVPQGAINGLVKLIASKGELYNLDLTDTVTHNSKSYPVVGGHKDNSATACPGKNLYDLLPTIKQMANSSKVYSSTTTNEKLSYTDAEPLREITEVRYGETGKVSVKLYNNGKDTWRSASTYLSLYEMYESDIRDSIKIKGFNSSTAKVASLKESSVGPGGTGTFEIEFDAGVKFGFVPLNLRGVLNGTMKNNLPIFVPVSVSEPSYSFDVVGKNTITLDPGEKKTIEVSIKNTGDMTWNVGSSKVKLGVSNPFDFEPQIAVKHSGQTPGRIMMLDNKTVKPGQTYKFDLKLEAPKDHYTSTLTESYTPVIDGVTWMRGDPITVNVKYKSSKTSKSSSSSRGEMDSSFEVPANRTSKVSFRIQNPTKETFDTSKVKIVRSFGNKLGIQSYSFGSKSWAPKKYVTVTVMLSPTSAVQETAQLRFTHNGQYIFNEPYLFTVSVDGARSAYIPPSPVTLASTTAAPPVTTVAYTPPVTQVTTTSTVATKDLGPDVRVHISKFAQNKTKLQVGGKGTVYVGGVNRGSVGSGTLITVEKNQYNVSATFLGKSYQGNIVRFVPDDISSVSTLIDFENRPAWNTALNDNSYRGGFEFRVLDSGLGFINELPLELYVRGLGEVSNGDPTEKIKTIMVAARSYAYYYTKGGGVKFEGKPYNLDDSPERTQKYIGYGYEKRSPNAVKAIEATAGEIITYNGKSVVIPYFNQSDGRTRSAKEVWGWTNAPYLVSVKDTNCATATKLLGHGVGISGCGATGMANKGYSYKEIIKYYLSGVEIGTMNK